MYTKQHILFLEIWGWTSWEIDNPNYLKRQISTIIGPPVDAMKIKFAESEPISRIRPKKGLLARIFG